MSLTLKDCVVIVAVSGVTTLNVFLQGALTVALPTIGKDLNFKQADLQWPVNVYALSYGCLLLFFGRISDIVGGRTMFILGSLWFSVWSIATAFALNDKAFIIFIALKGLGAAANTPAGIGLFSSYFPPGVKRNAAFGALGAGQPIGFILGLVLGGILTQSRATWRSIFYIQAGLGLIFVALGYLVLPKQHAAHRYTKGVDWGGTLLSTLGIGLLTYSLADSTTARRGWSTPQIPSLFSISAVILVLFVYYERWRESRNEAVLMPLSMWRQPGAKMGSVIGMVFFEWWSFNSTVYLVTLYFQQVNLLGPLDTSIKFIPITVSGFIMNLVAACLMSRVSGQLLILAGLVAAIAAPVIFALIDVNSSYWTMAFFVLILVVGGDVAYPVGNLQVVSHFDDNSQSLAGSVFTVATRIGTSVGLAVTSSIAASISAHYNKAHADLAADAPAVLMAGFRAASWANVTTAILSFVITCVGLRGIGIVGQKRNSNEHVLVPMKKNSRFSSSGRAASPPAPGPSAPSTQVSDSANV